ncbi:uncharacterized protein LOC129585775 isoform X2 [Paramacrobiotus metropolitanus]|uniref:uncharacterized protein LOC129585775 isoform X2 n=1 Tax=Paramacrobiotus metropolitanus TaxID=2943436 RepID=UPI002445D65E|nr:uncharacterized protein LOC129585775 isoform X2 [Paramacrobiotus metropolitanus]
MKAIVARGIASGIWLLNTLVFVYMHRTGDLSFLSSNHSVGFIGENNRGIGCPCSAPLSNRCAQCGLESFCGKMCNMTIDMSQLTTKHGAIYSPPSPGPIFCSFYVVANPSTRIQIDLYRMQGIGEYNPQTKRCIGGFLQIIDGVRALRGNSSAVHVFCGADSRFDRPVTIFKERAMAIIQYWAATAIQSRFMLEFSFHEKSEENYALGGTAIPNSECDWIYRQQNCSNSEEPCDFSTPGYPGLYSNYQHCRYFFRSTDPSLQIRIQFKTFDFPAGDCDTHYVNIFDGAYSTKTDPALQTLCGVQKTEEMIYFSTGPSLVIEFISGALSPPYNYTGFQGTVVFGNNPPDRIVGNKIEKTFCDWVFYSNMTPWASFSSPMDWFPKETRCRFKFIPTTLTDQVILSMHSYFLESDHCNTVIRIAEVDEKDEETHLIKRICGPASKYAAAGDQKAIEEYAAGAGKTLLLTFSSKNGNLHLGKTSEWISGSYFFHNERLLGKKILNTVCDYAFSSENVQPKGSVMGPKLDYNLDQQVWISTITTDCNYEFSSKSNQSISIQINQATMVKPGEETMFWLCRTHCNRHGCHCTMAENEAEKSHSLKDVFHIMVLSRQHPRVEISCFCGDLTDILPLTISAVNGAILRYHRLGLSVTDAHLYDFSAVYDFHEPLYECSRMSRNRHQGALYIVPRRNITMSANIIHHIQCDWTIEVTQKMYISLDIKLMQMDKSSANVKLSERSHCLKKNLVKLYTSTVLRDKDKGIEVCQNKAVTVNTNKLFIRLTATGTFYKHRILWKELNPSSIGRGQHESNTTNDFPGRTCRISIIAFLLIHLSLIFLWR